MMSTRPRLRLPAGCGTRCPETEERLLDNKDQVTGKLKQAVGDLIGDEDLKKEGKADEKAGDVKEFLEDLKDKASDLVDTVKDKFTKD